MCGCVHMYVRSLHVWVCAFVCEEFACVGVCFYTRTCPKSRSFTGVGAVCICMCIPYILGGVCFPELECVVVHGMFMCGYVHVWIVVVFVLHRVRGVRKM